MACRRQAAQRHRFLCGRAVPYPFWNNNATQALRQPIMLDTIASPPVLEQQRPPSSNTTHDTRCYCIVSTPQAPVAYPTAYSYCFLASPIQTHTMQPRQSKFCHTCATHCGVNALVIRRCYGIALLHHPLPQPRILHAIPPSNGCFRKMTLDKRSHCPTICRKEPELQTPMPTRNTP